MSMKPKDPWIAGISSAIFPGAGQFYNEQNKTGIMILLILLISFVLLLMKLGFIPFRYPAGLIFHSEMLYSHYPMMNISIPAEVYAVLWIFVIVPGIYLFSIIDAVQYARRSRLTYAESGHHPYHANEEDLGAVTMAKKRLFTHNPQDTTGSQPPPLLHPWLQTQETQQPPVVEKDPPQAYARPQMPPPPPRGQSQHRSMSGKIFLGMILFFVGLVGFLNAMDIEIFSSDTFIRIIPLFMLFWGVRLLRDYDRKRDRGHLVLGVIVLSLGTLFTIEAGEFGEPIEFLFEYWWAVFLVAGGVIVLSDAVKKRRMRRYQQRHR